MSVDVHTHRLTISHDEGTPALVRYFDLLQLFLGGCRLDHHWLHKFDGRRLGCQPFGPVCTFLFPGNRHSVRRNHERLSDQAGDQDLPLPPECMFPALFDLSNPFHRLDRSLHQLAIVADRDISALLEIDCSILRTSNTLSKKGQGHEMPVILTTVISFPAALRKALVHRTLRGLRFILIASAIDVEKSKAC